MNIKTKFKGRMLHILLGASLCAAPAALAQSDQDTEALQQKIERLSRELSQAKQQLAASESKRVEAERAVENLKENETKYADAADLGPSKITPGDLIPALEGLKIGGAIRANYVLGEYGGETGAPSSDFDDGGNFVLDLFRINADYTNGQFLAKFEYRFYNSYHMLHTGWIGYEMDSGDQLQVGVNRVPFGPGAYGISQSWFFDQHYYVGLADDMDLGVKYSGSRGDLSFDFAYYYGDEGHYAGSSKNAARYSYDAVVDNAGDGHEERNQFNARAIYALEIGEVAVDLGGSAQFGSLEGVGTGEDGDHYALSFHPTFKLNNWTLSTQLTKYDYDVESDLITFGAFDYTTEVATDAWIAGASLSYYHEIAAVDWVDYVIPFVEYSSIMKEEDGFNDSDLLTIGAAWGRGGWYIYTEYAASNGNDFVGNENYLRRFGDNPNEDWQGRFNINFGYYF